MPSGRLTDEQFIAEWHRHGSALAMAKALNRDVRSIMKRRGALSAKGVPLQTRAAPVTKAGFLKFGAMMDGRLNGSSPTISTPGPF